MGHKEIKQVEANYFEDSTSSKSGDHITESYGETATKIDHNFKNLTKEQLASLLEKHGYLVKYGYGGWPLGMIGDVYYYPEELLPELGALQARRNILIKEKLWVVDGRETNVPYYYDTSSQADHNVFEAAVKTWADNTCIMFTKKPPNNCQVDLGEATICVGNFGGCFSRLGRAYGPQRRHSQQMSVAPDGCEVAAAAHEFGHALGLCHEMARADREKFIHVIYENIDLDINSITNHKIRSAWFQGGQCSAEQMYDVPKPYDPMSLMQYGTSDFAMEDQRPVYLHKKPHYQYMFDYHRACGYVQTHYDLLVVNTAYQCIAKWTKSCAASGQSVPKCDNYGYVGKDCKCMCPKGFSGSTCGTKDGPMFPVMDRAKAMLDISEPGLVDMKGKGMHDENHNYPRDDFVNNQFITVVIKSGDETRITVDVDQDFSVIARDFAFSAENKWLKVPSAECRYGVRLYIGESEVSKVRVECISSILSNEVKEYRPVLRSRSNELDIIGMSGWGACYSGGPPIGRKAMEFRFTVGFLDRPEEHLSVEKKNPGKVGETVDKAKKAIAKALNVTKSQVPMIIGVAVGLLVLVAAAGGGAYWWFKIRKPADGEESKSETKKRPPSPSSSDTSDSSD